MTIPTPTLDGEIIVFGEFRLTEDQARGLGYTLTRLSHEAEAAGWRRRAREVADQLAAEFRRDNPGAVEIDALLVPVFGDLPKGLRVFVPRDGKTSWALPCMIPTHPRIRYRSERSPVTHLWEGGEAALCGALLWEPGGPGGSRECAKCMAKAGGR